jgi:hypothetical protein
MDSLEFAKIDLPHVKTEEWAFSPAQLLLVSLNEIRSLRAKVDKLENDAAEMMSPDKMMEMATNFLGGGLTP